MSTLGQVAQQLQQDIQNELITANQLLQLISVEVATIKQLTEPDGELACHIKENASLMSTLADLREVDIENLPTIIRTQVDMSNPIDENLSYEQHDTFRNSSNMEDSQ